jgi:hypothetical protein
MMIRPAAVGVINHDEGQQMGWEGKQCCGWMEGISSLLRLASEQRVGKKEKAAKPMGRVRAGGQSR